MDLRFLPAATTAIMVTLATACGGGGEYVAGGQAGNGTQQASSEQAASSQPTASEPDAAAAQSEAPATATTQLQVPEMFDWSSTVNVSLNLQLFEVDGTPASGVGVEVYPAVESALSDGMREPYAEELFGLSPYLQAVSSADGSLSAQLQIPGHVAELEYVYVVTRLLGVASVAYVPVSASDAGYSAQWTFGLASNATAPVAPSNDGFGQRQALGNAASGDYFLSPFFNHYEGWYGYPYGTWVDNACDMETMIAGEVCTVAVESSTLEMLDAALPPGGSPEQRFLEADTSASNLEFSKPAKVLATFLHEGAGYQNTFGFFSYDPANPPLDHASVDGAKVLFPNTSLAGSGGGLRSGTSIFLGEIDPATSPAGLGFWLAANGWTSGLGRGYNGHHFYTLTDLNPEADRADRKHIVMLADEVDLSSNTRTFWLGFEDIRLDLSYSDKDYNDLIVQIEVSPADALANLGNIPIIGNDDTTVDADQDGVTSIDDIDDNDASRAFEQYYPGENDWGTLLAEDNWPLQGDYDMNDLVVRYRVREVLDSSAQVKDISIEYRLEARGAAFHNGFALSLGDSVFADNVASATLNGENVAPQADAVYLSYSIFDDAWAHTWQGGSAQCWTFNTLSECPQNDVSTFNFELTFANAVTRQALGAAPYNPYVYAHKVGSDVGGYTRLNATGGEIYRENGSVRDIEIHLPHHLPTSGQDSSLFGSGDDASDGVESFYVNSSNLPWMIDVPYSIEYPAEFVDISEAFPLFTDWVQSGGTNSLDWYLTPAQEPGLTFTGVQ